MAIWSGQRDLSVDRAEQALAELDAIVRYEWDRPARQVATTEAGEPVMVHDLTIVYHAQRARAAIQLAQAEAA